MLIGCTYDEAAAKLCRDPTILDTSGIGYHHVESQLVEHGFAVARKWRIAQPGNQHREPWPCSPFSSVHWCQVDAGGRGAHAVVMLADGTVLDPMTDEPKRLTDYKQVDFVAAVVPLAPPQSQTPHGDS